MDKIQNFARNNINSPARIIGLFVLVLIVGGVLSLSIGNFGGSDNNTETGQEQDQTTPIANFALLYGNWAGNQTQIFAYDMQNRKEYVLATLPINIKKVTQISDTELLFINNTDERDHGRELAIYSMATKGITPIYTADDGFGIDDYQISPDKKFVSTWEVQFAPNSDMLLGGRSKVYNINVTTPNSKFLIFDEQASTPVHYPVAITNSGEVFMDRFLPNSGAGWAYGMSTSDYTGTNKSDLTNMAAGTYGTQPKISRDGQYILFGGYNGSLGNGNDLVNNFRRALLSTNTVDLLNTSSKGRISLPVSSENTYSEVSWEDATGNIKLVVLSKDHTQTGTFLFNISSESLTPVDSQIDTQLIADLGQGVKIFGKNDNTASVFGNLGDGYASPFIRIFAQIGDQEIDIPTSVALSQIIGLIPSSGLDTSNLETIEQAEAADEVRLSSFEIKPQLEEDRNDQQSEFPPTAIPTPTPTPRVLTPTATRGPTPTPRPRLPECLDLAVSQCNATMGTDFSRSESQDLRHECIEARITCVNRENNPVQLSIPGRTQTEAAFGKCVYTQWNTGAKEKTCSDSPLYLYGKKGMKVEVGIYTDISGENILGKKDGNVTKYNFKLMENGMFESDGSSYSSLSFDYIPQGRVKPPLTGEVIKSSEVETKTKEYGKKLGLNQREVNDLVKDINSKVTNNYVFLSFFDQKTSKYLLPITFAPVPDTYINYVFYLKNLGNPQDLGYTPKTSVFEKTPRGEFTAVEVSVISE